MLFVLNLFWGKKYFYLTDIEPIPVLAVRVSVKAFLVIRPPVSGVLAVNARLSGFRSAEIIFFL